MLFGKNSPSFLDPAYLKVLSDPSKKSRPARERVFQWFRDPESRELRPAEIPPFYGDAFGEYVGLPQDDLAVTPTQYRCCWGWLASSAPARTACPSTPTSKPWRTARGTPRRSWAAV